MDLPDYWWGSSTADRDKYFTILLMWENSSSQISIA